jgi:hypothetical protein
VYKTWAPRTYWPGAPKIDHTRAVEPLTTRRHTFSNAFAQNSNTIIYSPHNLQECSFMGAFKRHTFILYMEHILTIKIEVQIHFSMPSSQMDCLLEEESNHWHAAAVPHAHFYILICHFGRWKNVSNWQGSVQTFIRRKNQFQLRFRICCHTADKLLFDDATFKSIYFFWPWLCNATSFFNHKRFNLNFVFIVR